jgi:hypothetical protein
MFKIQSDPKLSNPNLIRVFDKEFRSEESFNKINFDPTTKQLYQSDPIRNEYFCSEIRTNPIGSDLHTSICASLIVKSLLKDSGNCNNSIML